MKLFLYFHFHQWIPKRSKLTMSFVHNGSFHLDFFFFPLYSSNRTLHYATSKCHIRGLWSNSLPSQIVSNLIFSCKLGWNCITLSWMAFSRLVPNSPETQFAFDRVTLVFHNASFWTTAKCSLSFFSCLMGFVDFGLVFCLQVLFDKDKFLGDY